MKFRTRVHYYEADKGRVNVSIESDSLKELWNIAFGICREKAKQTNRRAWFILKDNNLNKLSGVVMVSGFTHKLIILDTRR